MNGSVKHLGSFVSGWLKSWSFSVAIACIVMLLLPLLFLPLLLMMILLLLLLLVLSSSNTFLTYEETYDMRMDEGEGSCRESGDGFSHHEQKFT